MTAQLVMFDEAREVLSASDWAQRWRNGRHSWRHASEGGFDPGKYEVAAIATADAKRYVVENHYSASFPSDKLNVGLHRRGRLVGVATFSTPAGPLVLPNTFPDLEPSHESIELGRFLLADECPGNSESWFLARAFKLVEQAGIVAVLSFSDPMPRRRADGELLFPGHIGTIYQASNARYCGRSYAEPFIVFHEDNWVLNKRAMQKVRKQEQGHDYVERELIARGASPRIGRDKRAWLRNAVAEAINDGRAHRVRGKGKHRYVFALGTPSQRRRLRVPFDTLPYPKELDQEVAA